MLESLVARSAGLWMRVTGRRGIAKIASRWILGLHGQRSTLQGLHLLEGNGPTVLIANRSGVLDPLVVAASVPEDVRFAERSALNRLPGSLTYLLAPLVLGHEQNDTTPAAGVLRDRVAAALEKTGGKKGAAAALLGCSWPTLNRKIREYGL